MRVVGRGQRLDHEEVGEGDDFGLVEGHMVVSHNVEHKLIKYLLIFCKREGVAAGKIGKYSESVDSLFLFRYTANYQGVFMCWSGEASLAVATIGVAGTLWSAYKKDPIALWGCLGYFTLMELLQAYTYIVINQCNLPSNQIATLLGYLHVTFQPFFINAMSMYFIPERIRKKIEYPVYFLCFVSAIYMLIQLYPFDWAGKCLQGRFFCGPKLCSVSGSWHIAWEIPLNGIGNWSGRSFLAFLVSGSASYPIVAFALPFLYGSWRFTAYTFIMGPLLASFLTNNYNEHPAIWCLLSIGFLLIVIKTPIRGLLHVKKWVLWPRDSDPLSK